MKKWIIITLTVSSVISLCVNIKDVNPSLPVYEAVKFVVENGIMEVDEKGYFKGAESVSRFDLARYIFNLVRAYKLSRLVALDDIYSRIEKLERELDSRKEELELLLKNRITIEASVNSLVAELDTIKKTLETLPKPAPAQNEITVPEYLKKGCEENSELYEDIASLKRKYSSLFEYLNDLRDKLKELENSISNTTRLDDLEKEIEDLNEKVSTNEKVFTSELNALKTELSKLKKDTGKNSEITTSLKDRIKHIEDECGKCEADLKSVQDKIDVAFQELSELSFQNESEHEKLRSDLIDISTELENINVDLKNKILRMKNEIESLKNLGLKRDKKLDDLQKSLDAARSEMNELKKVVSNLGERFLSSDETIKANIHSLESSFTSLENELGDLKEKLEMSNERYISLARRTIHLEKEMDSKFSQNDLRIGSLESELGDLKHRIASMERYLISTLKEIDRSVKNYDVLNVNMNLERLKKRVEWLEEEVVGLSKLKGTADDVKKLKEYDENLHERAELNFKLATLGIAIGVMGSILALAALLYR